MHAIENFDEYLADQNLLGSIRQRNGNAVKIFCDRGAWAEKESELLGCIKESQGSDEFAKEIGRLLGSTRQWVTVTNQSKLEGLLVLVIRRTVERVVWSTFYLTGGNLFRIHSNDQGRVMRGIVVTLSPDLRELASENSGWSVLTSCLEDRLESDVSEGLYRDIGANESEMILENRRVLVEAKDDAKGNIESWQSRLELTPILSRHFGNYCLDQSNRDEADDFRGIADGVIADDLLIDAFGRDGLSEQARLDSIFLERLGQIAQSSMSLMLFHLFECTDSDEEPITLISADINRFESLITRLPEDTFITFL